jgi:methylisocitrate lyase
LKQLIQADEILVMPGVHDALSARIAAAEGFRALTLGGFAASGVLLGEPDSSQLSLRELADHYARVCGAVELPIFADGDTGFGNVTNVARTVRELERAGVAGLFIEDQVFPKRCGHTPGKDVIHLEEMIGKLKSALDSRRDPDLVIMGRTDALAVHGLDAAIERAQAFAEIGCDLVFVEAPATTDDMKRICGSVDAPQLANMIEFGQTPTLDANQLESLGYATVVWPVASVFALTKQMRSLYRTIAETGSTEAFTSEMVTFDDYMKVVGLPELRAREQSFLDFAKERGKS